jgi:cystathionine beta-lyase/cystathionine gamma-synthase
MTPQQREKYRIPDNMIRLACGIEDATDLIADLRQALEAAAATTAGSAPAT